MCVLFSHWHVQPCPKQKSRRIDCLVQKRQQCHMFPSIHHKSGAILPSIAGLKLIPLSPERTPANHLQSVVTPEGSLRPIRDPSSINHPQNATSDVQGEAEGEWIEHFSPRGNYPNFSSCTRITSNRSNAQVLRTRGVPVTQACSPTKFHMHLGYRSPHLILKAVTVGIAWLNRKTTLLQTLPSQRNSLRFTGSDSFNTKLST